MPSPSCSGSRRPRRLSSVTASGLRIPADEVVPGDVLVLAEGEAVAADGRLATASSLLVAEAVAAPERASRC